MILKWDQSSFFSSLIQPQEWDLTLVNFAKIERGKGTKMYAREWLWLTFEFKVYGEKQGYWGEKIQYSIILSCKQFNPLASVTLSSLLYLVLIDPSLIPLSPMVYYLTSFPKSNHLALCTLPPKLTYFHGSWKVCMDSFCNFSLALQKLIVSMCQYAWHQQSFPSKC